MVWPCEFRGRQMSERSLETWSFPASASHTAASSAWLGPRGSADAPEQALKWDPWCCHQPLCTDNTLCGSGGCAPGPVPEHLFCPLTFWLVSDCHSGSVYMHLLSLYLSVTAPVSCAPCRCPSCGLYQWIPHSTSEDCFMSSVCFLVWSGHSNLKVVGFSILTLVCPLSAVLCHQLSCWQ